MALIRQGLHSILYDQNEENNTFPKIRGTSPTSVKTAHQDGIMQQSNVNSSLRCHLCQDVKEWKYIYIYIFVVKIFKTFNGSLRADPLSIDGER